MILILLLISSITLIFFLMLSSAKTSKSSYKSATGTEGNPPPVPISRMFCPFFGFRNKFIASESKIVFRTKVFRRFLKLG